MATIDSVKLPDNSTYDLTDNYSGYQTETLATPITVDETSKTTVEGTLGAVNDYADKIKDNLAGRNLFDNGWFTLNERGVSGNHYQDYMADRWDSYGFAGTQISTDILSNGIRIQSSSIEGWRALQNIKNYKMLSGKVVTLSVNIISATPIGIAWFYSTSPNGSSGTWVVIGTTSTTGISSITFTVPDLSSATGLCIAFQGAESQDITIRVVKLELGSVSTLANDVAPDDALELAKCRASTADPSDTYANKGNLVNYADLTTIHATGSTNTTGAQIDKDALFYLNGTLCKALTNIAANATFTLNTNYKLDTVNDELLKVRIIEYDGSAANDKAFFTDVINHIISLYGGSGLTFQFIVGGLKQTSYYYKGIGYGYFGGGSENYISLQCSSYTSEFLILASGGVIQIRQIDGTLI